jgi:hypothetical protein
VLSAEKVEIASAKQQNKVVMEHEVTSVKSSIIVF